MPSDQSGYPRNIGHDFPENRAFAADLQARTALSIYPTIAQSRVGMVNPSYVDFGEHDFDAGDLFSAGQSHVSLALVEADPGCVMDETAATIEVRDTNRQHRKFGWEEPADPVLARRIGYYLLDISRSQLDWGMYGGHRLAINLEAVRTSLPLPVADRDTYDETLHTDLVHPFIPVAQVFWADTRHSIISLTPAHIGEGQESVRSNYSEIRSKTLSYEPTNVLYHDGNYKREQLPDGHLIVADAKRFPHGRPDLSQPLARSRFLGRLLEPTIRHYIRAYIAPVLSLTEIPDTTALTLKEQLSKYGSGIISKYVP